jgi:hypothetical protein
MAGCREQKKVSKRFIPYIITPADAAFTIISRPVAWISTVFDKQDVARTSADCRRI